MGRRESKEKRLAIADSEIPGSFLMDVEKRNRINQLYYQLKVEVEEKTET
jgi:hypothetical protein